jgi:hypothetical protein
MSYSLTFVDTDGTSKMLDVDAVTREGSTSVAEITENPIESGAVVTDHIRVKPDTLTLEFKITNTPIRQPQSHMNGVTSSVGQSANGNASVLTWSGAFNRVVAVEADLLRIQAAGLLWTITSDIRVYSNFLLEQIQANKDDSTGDSADFILSFKLARFVDTRVTNIPQLRRVRPQIPAGQQPTQPPRNSLSYNALHGALTGLGF